MSRIAAPIHIALIVMIAAAAPGCTTLSSLRRELAEQPPKRKTRHEQTLAAFEAQRDAAQLQAALSRFSEGNYPACEELLTSLVVRQPQNVEARLQLAEFYLFREQAAAAEEQLHAALVIAPQRGDLHDCLARVLDASGRSSEALVHFQKAAEFDPQSDLSRLTAAAPHRGTKATNVSATRK